MACHVNKPGVVHRAKNPRTLRESADTKLLRNLIKYQGWEILAKTGLGRLRTRIEKRVQSSLTNG